MIDEKRIAKALKICARECCPEECPRYLLCGCDGEECARDLMETAADMIESLQAQLAELQAKYDKLNDFEQSQCAKLLSQLAASQRREKAAVEDFFTVAHMVGVSNLSYYDFKKVDTLVNKWRGPEAGEEADEKQRQG